MAKTELVETEAPGAVGEVQALEPLYESVDQADIQFPQIKLLYPLSEMVKNGVADDGDVIFAYGNDDPNPTILIGDGTESFSAFILGSDKTAARAVDGDIEWTGTRDPNDPNSHDVWFFYLYLPKVEALIPARIMLWKAAGATAARQLTTLMARAQAMKATDPVAVKFTVSSKTSKNGRHTYKYLVVQPTEADPDDVALARDMIVKYKESRAKYNSPQLPAESYEDQPGL